MPTKQQETIGDGPWIAYFDKNEEDTSLLPLPDGAAPSGAWVPAYPAFRVWHSATRSRRSHLAALWASYSPLRFEKVGRFEHRRKFLNGIELTPERIPKHRPRVLPKCRWVRGDHGRADCGPVLTGAEKVSLGLDLESGAIVLDTSGDDSETLVRVPAWLPSGFGGLPVPAWSETVRVTRGDPRNPRALALVAWSRHVRACRPDLPLPRRLPNGSTYENAGSNANPARRGESARARAANAGKWAGWWTMVTVPARRTDEPGVFETSRLFAMPGGVRPDWRRVVCEALGVNQVPRGSRAFADSVRHAAAIVIGDGQPVPPPATVRAFDPSHFEGRPIESYLTRQRPAPTPTEEIGF